MTHLCWAGSCTWEDFARLGGPPREAQSPQAQAGPWGLWLPILSPRLDKEGCGWPGALSGWSPVVKQFPRPFQPQSPYVDKGRGHEALPPTLQNCRLVTMGTRETFKTGGHGVLMEELGGSREDSALSQDCHCPSSFPFTPSN